MENTSPPHSSCISPASVSAGESSWAIHFAEFMVSSNSRQEMGGQGGGASQSSFYSSFDSLGDDEDEDDSFIKSDPIDEDDEEDSLRDTACSSLAGPKATSMYDLYMKSMATMDAKEMSSMQLAKYFHEAGSREKVNGAAQEVISGAISNEKPLYECSDLRKKGLCLVPISMLIDYQG